MKTVHCEKLQQDLEGLSHPPYPGVLGERIYKHISKAAWQQWKNQQIMLINEYRLSMIDPKARAFLETEMEKFFFGEGSQRPEGYTPVDGKSD